MERAIRVPWRREDKGWDSRGLRVYRVFWVEVGGKVFLGEVSRSVKILSFYAWIGCAGRRGEAPSRSE